MSPFEYISNILIFGNRYEKLDLIKYLTSELGFSERKIIISIDLTKSIEDHYEYIKKEINYYITKNKKDRLIEKIEIKKYFDPDEKYNNLFLIQSDDELKQFLITENHIHDSYNITEPDPTFQIIDNYVRRIKIKKLLHILKK